MKQTNKLSEKLIREITGKGPVQFLESASENNLSDLVWGSFFYGFVGACIMIMGMLTIINFLL